MQKVYFRSGIRNIEKANAVYDAFYKEGFYDEPERFTSKNSKEHIDATLMHMMALKRNSQGRFEDAIDYALQSADLFLADGNETDVAMSYSILCICYSRISDLETAMDYAVKCYEIDLKGGNPSYISSALNNIAGICLMDHKNGEAKKYIDEALTYERTLDDSRALAIRLGMACEIYSALGEYGQALSFAGEAYKLDIEAGREENAGKRLSQMAAVYYAEGHYPLAEKCYKGAIKLLEKHDCTNSLAITYNQLGGLACKDGRLRDSELYLRKAVEYAAEVKNNIQLQKAYDLLSTVLESTSPKEALHCLKLSKELQTAIFNAESEKQINNFNIQYHVREKEAQIAAQQTRQTVLTVILILCVIVLAATSVIIVLIHRHNLRLKRVNAVKNKFFSIISHDMKNPVIAQTNALEMLYNNYEKLPPKEAESILAEIYDSSKSLNALLDSLLGWAKFESGNIPFNPACFPLIDAVREAIEVSTPQAEAKGVKINNAIPSSALCLGDRNMITTVIRNLIGNAIKFSDMAAGDASSSQADIIIEASDTGRFWSVSVRDHGVGIAPEALENLFRIGHSSSKGTSGEKGSGLGLLLCNDMVKLNGGTIFATSHPGEGSVFTFTVKKATIHG